MAVNQSGITIRGNKKELQGLSTDTKPINDSTGNRLGSGSIFYELDTGKGFIFDTNNICPATNNNWWPV